MHLVPTQEEVIALLRQTGALREGHFEYPNGLHANEYMQLQLATRYYQHAKVLSVGLSRLLRANAEIRAAIPELSIISPGNGGVPVAYGVCEALRAHQVYWAERQDGSAAIRFRQYLTREAGEKAILVDDILRSGRTLAELKRLVESSGAEVLGIGILVYQPGPQTVDVSPLPLYYLAKLHATYYKDEASCELCRRGTPVEKVWT